MREGEIKGERVGCVERHQRHSRIGKGGEE